MTRNYNSYIKGMEKGNTEKLFFLKNLDINEYKTIIDFGCGKADILKACAGNNRRFIGIDCDPVMIELAKKNVPEAEFYSELDRNMLDEDTIIIFSSVLHEIGSYWYTLEKILENTGVMVVIRDMRFSGPDNELVSKKDLSKLIRKSNPHILSEFIEEYGMTFVSSMYHYLLKYSYIDNWELELAENYFSFDYNEIKKLGFVLYENNYTLQFKKEKVKSYYGIDMKYGTHTQIILKIKEKTK